MKLDAATTFDPVRYKADQRRGWSRAAEGWGHWWDTFERAAQVVSDRLVAAAEVRPGHAVLDVATGIGEPAVTAARRVGPAGRVVAIDQAPRMLEVARRRMASLGLTNLEFLEMDAEAAPLPEASFDAVLSRWGLMFLPDLDASLARFRDLLRPGGKLAAAVWDEAERVPLLGLASATFRDVLGAAPPPGAPTPHALADSHDLRARLEAAGFEEVAVEPIPVTFDFDSAADYARFVREVGPPPPALEELSPAHREEVWSALAAAAGAHRRPDGKVVLHNVALVASGRRCPAEPRIREGVPERPACPFCGGRETRLESPFGSTLGFAQYWCETCRTVFEYLKWDRP